MTRRQTEHYRELARDCQKLAQTLPVADQRTVLLEMADEWLRLADQQERAPDLGQQEQIQQQQQSQTNGDEKNG